MAGLPFENFPARPKLVFMGTPEFAVSTLRALLDHGYAVMAVVSQPDKPQGRGKRVAASPVKRLALERQVPVLQPEKASAPEFCDQIQAMSPDLIIVVAFGQILRKKLLDIPRWGVVNIHASLLPKLRGAAPIQWAVMNNERLTGLTVMRMDEGMDTGPILLQEEVPMIDDETAGHLHDRLSILAGDLMVRALRAMAEGKVKEKPQNSAEATYAPKIDKNMGLVDWSRPGDEVSAFIRALDPKPGAYTLLKTQELKLFSSTVVDGNQAGTIPGRVRGQKDACLVVDSGRGTVGIRELQLPGKKKLQARDFLRGVSIPEGSILGIEHKC
jgi:methionyl-tRNA formyltransferase